MNITQITKSLALAAALLAATTAIAAPENSGKGSVYLDSTTTVNGTQLAPGNYNLKWTTTSSGTELQLIGSKNAVTTVPAHVVNLDRKSAQSTVDTTRTPGGATVLNAIHLSGKSFAFTIDETNAASASTTTSGQK
jgi:hypothetical protein